MQRLFLLGLSETYENFSSESITEDLRAKKKKKRKLKKLLRLTNLFALDILPLAFSFQISVPPLIFMSEAATTPCSAEAGKPFPWDKLTFKSL